MRRFAIIALTVMLGGCTSAGVVSEETSSSSVSSATGAVLQVSSSSSSVDPKAPKIYLEWQVKKLPVLIKGIPRRRLSLIVSGASRQLVYAGTFSGENVDTAGTYVIAPNAILKASISWKESGDEIWVEKDEATSKLVIHHRNIDEKRQYLSVDRILSTADIPGGATVLPRQ